MTELIRFQQLRPASSISRERAKQAGLSLYPDDDLTQFAQVLRDAPDRSTYKALLERHLKSDEGERIRDLHRENPVIRKLYEWLDFKARPVLAKDLGPVAASLDSKDLPDLPKEWRRIADNFLIAIEEDVVAKNYRIDFQRLIRVCHLIDKCLTADNQSFKLVKGASDTLIAEILERPIVLPAGFNVGPRRDNPDKSNRMKIPERNPPTSSKPPNCTCTCDTSCHEPKHYCMIMRPFVGDLFMICEELARYEAGDLADIENVLAGEMKVRKHRILNRTEETVEVDTETTVSTERDHSVSERSSLQTEVKQTADQKIHLDAGVTATLKYGESITVTPHADVTADWAKSQSQSTARSYAKDLVDRAVVKLEEKSKRQEITKTLREIEERNKHSIKNDDLGAVHRAGLYYWVNRISHAQVMGYGRHLMFDMIVAEPAATWRALYAKKMAKDAADKEPSKPAIKPGDITPGNYGQKLLDYGLAGEDLQPPVATTSVEMAFSQNMGTPDDDKTLGFSSHEFRTPELPAGYKAKTVKYDIRVSVGHPQSTDKNDQAVVTVNLADRCLFSHYMNEWKDGGGQSNKEWFETQTKPLNGEEGSLTLSIAGYSSLAVAVSGSLTIIAEPNQETLEGWRLSVFNTIMGDYRRKLDAYNANRGKDEGLFEIKGRNPFLNREIERNEIKRHVIAALMCNYFPDMGSMVEHMAPCGYPEIDFEKLEKDAPVIRFFEQIFEWEYVTYLFYHSMWARKCKWVELIDENSGDPLFDKFLTAGAARVQIPVRPGMEKIFLWFLATGQLWGASGQPPLPGDAEYVSMIQELKEAKQGDYADRPGLVAATNGTNQVLLTKSEFYWDSLANALDQGAIDNDRDREILIEFEVYRIVDVVQTAPGDPTQWTITIERAFEGKTATNLKHAVGAVFVGAPWEVVTPTQLVYLNNPTDKLPVYPLP